MSLHQEIVKTADRIQGYINHTLIQYSPYLSKLNSGRVFLKLENTQKTGSFKFRGAISKISSLSSQEKSKGVITASTGNHGAACSLAMSLMNVKGSIIVPKNSQTNKIDKIKLYGADIEFFGQDCIDAEMRAQTISKDSGSVFISPYNDNEIIFGQGTIGYELEQDIDNIDAVFISVGGGGLISGIGGYLKSIHNEISIFGVSPINSCVMFESLKSGELLEIPSMPTLSDGTAGGVEKDSITFDYCKKFIDEFLTVTEDQIIEGMIGCIEKDHCLVEGAAGAAVAGYLKKANELKGKTVVIVICGGNINLKILKEIIR